MRLSLSSVAIGLLFGSIPVAAVAAPRLGVGAVFGDADELNKLLMLLLVAAAFAGVVVTGLKLASGKRLSGGSAFVSALRLGAPLMGLVGAAYVMLMMFIGIANFGGTVPLPMLAPGFAEAAMLFLLGVMGGVVGVVGHWIIESRIDRAVLRS